MNALPQVKPPPAIMFRKPKRKLKALRPKTSEEDEEQQAQQPDAANSKYPDEQYESTTSAGSTTRELLEEARKRVKQSSTTVATTALKSTTTQSQKISAGSGIMHTYNTSKEKPITAHDLVVSTAEHHPAAADAAAPHSSDNTISDGIFRNAQRNAFHAGPLRAAASVRVTARFDYQPDVCKDYKDTGFCGFGDTCIYLHDRGDTLTGWQLDQQWEQEQKAKKEQQQREKKCMPMKIPLTTKAFVAWRRTPTSVADGLSLSFPAKCLNIWTRGMKAITFLCKTMILHSDVKHVITIIIAKKSSCSGSDTTTERFIVV